ncbi:MAG: tetratricopeptide repeat protein [Bacteroidetes bacterium]|nr:MAG: tetratricopeptide repeat protein [Bacteroidota bacterium]
MGIFKIIQRPAWNSPPPLANFPSHLFTMNTRLQQALSFLAEAPEDAFSLYAVAYEYLQAGELSQARAYFERLRDLHPTYVGLYYHLGRVLQQQGEIDQAEATFRVGLQVARAQRDAHAGRELQAALDALLGLDYEDEV